MIFAMPIWHGRLAQDLLCLPFWQSGHAICHFGSRGAPSAILAVASSAVMAWSNIAVWVIQPLLPPSGESGKFKITPSVIIAFVKVYASILSSVGKFDHDHLTFHTHILDRFDLTDETLVVPIPNR